MKSMHIFDGPLAGNARVCGVCTGDECECDVMYVNVQQVANGYIADVYRQINRLWRYDGRSFVSDAMYSPESNPAEFVEDKLTLIVSSDEDNLET